MRHAILLGKVILKLSKKLKLGSGSTWPGHLALKADKNLIRKIISRNPHLKVVLIAGTNGKTTTTKALKTVLEENSMQVTTNESGANLLNGLATLISKNVNMKGKFPSQALIFECDENTLPKVLLEIPNPSCIILLNLFRDQLDRYGEVNTIAENWRKALSSLDDRTSVIANADDPLIAYIAMGLKNRIFFSVPKELKTSRSLSHAVDSTTCPVCRSGLDYLNVSYSHLGNYICPNCSFKNPKSEARTIETKLSGLYNQYNLNAVFESAKKVFGIDDKKIVESLQSMEPAFGRQEVMDIDGKKVMLLLSKNPTGLNESLKVAIENKSPTLLIVLNDRIPDGRDISWIWDVDFENLRHKRIKIYISGDRAFDLANRLAFANISCEVLADYKQSFEDAINKTLPQKMLLVLPTYSAMLEIRKLISGKSIL